MRDVIFIALIVAFVAVTIHVIVVCDRIATAAGVDELLDELLPPPSEPSSRER